MTYVEDYKERIKMPLHFETSEFQKKDEGRRSQIEDALLQKN